MPKVTVIGSANVDLTIQVDRLPHPGETVSDGRFYTSFGGKGANQAVAAVRAGAQVRFLAKVGRDLNAERILRRLKAQGIHTDFILRDEEDHSGVALIMVDRHGRNAIAVAPGSNRKLTPEEIRGFEPLKGWGDVLLIQLEVPLDAAEEALTLAQMWRLRTILNPAPARLLDGRLLARVDILTPNERELEQLSGMKVKGETTAVEACRKLLEQGVGEVIVTLGEHGALHVTRKGQKPFPGCRVEAVDTTAAGDAFNGALACALAEGQTMEDAIRFANAAGALAATKRGAQDSLPHRDEIESLLQASK